MDKVKKYRKIKSKKKRKLSLEQIGKCNPKITSKNKCIPNTVYSKLSKILHTSDVFKAVGCNDGEENCLINKAPLNDNEKSAIRSSYLRPMYPTSWEKDPDMWLDNFNIGDVMKQYTVTYPWFSFLGILPIDFSAPSLTRKDKCLYSESCELNIKNEYKKGIRGIGIIFNLDPHYKGGSHWVALYINLHNIKKPFIGYFDSYGYKPPPLIGRFMRSMLLQVPTCTLGFNGRQFQFGNSECGMFSMYYIICMIRGISFKEFCKDSVNDDYMLQLRHVLFSK